jgi:hypothetical protein
MKKLNQILHACGFLALATIAASPVQAGTTVPGPLLGAGAPALALFAGAYYLIRKRRSR